MTNEPNRRILVIDDTRSIHQDFRKILERPDRQGSALDSLEAELFGEAPAESVQVAYELDSAYSGEEGCQRVREALAEGRRYSLAFVDMRMPPGWDGVQTIEHLWEVDPDIQVVICTAYSDYSWEDILRRFGASDRLLILKKPFDTAEVCQLACALTEKWRLTRHAHLKLSQLSSMVAEQTTDLRSANHRLEAEVAERRRAEIALRVSESRYAVAAAGANDGLWDWDLMTDELYLSDRWWAMLGLPPVRTGRPSDWFDRVHVDDAERVREEVARHLAGSTSHFGFEFRAIHGDGHDRWFLCRGVVVRNEIGRPIRAAGSHADITDRKLVEEQLRHDALHDGLTGLANRVLLTDRLDRCIARQVRDRQYRFALLYLDLDRFKDINDSLGHVAGDQLLVAIGDRIARSVRFSDTVARDHVLARVGGDEFVILLEEILDGAAAVRVADRLLTLLAEPFEVAGHVLFTSASIGVATSESGYLRAEDLIRDADTALYRAKAGGRGRYELFDPSMHTTAVARWRMENDLRSAVERGELRLQFQPIVNAGSTRVVELEALVRWDRPGFGRVHPDQFVPLAEETGAIVPIGEWVLREACRQILAWKRTDPELARCTMAVNVSGRQFADPAFPDIVAGILAETGVSPSQIKLEITETALMQLDTTTDACIGRLRELGVSLYLDDFGTGFASLSYLHRIQVDGLKIDRSFVRLLGDDRMSTSIVQTIVTLARLLQLGVVAEGVESQHQLDQVRAAGCQLAQGYLFSRPIDADQVPAVFHRAGKVTAG
ncbi:MAG: EAL domain-containing protein [Myxococcota bacterium]